LACNTHLWAWEKVLDRNRRADPGARGRLPAGSQGQSPAGVGRSWL